MNGGLCRDIGQLIRDWPPAVALIAMIKTLVTEERLQSRREEIANSVSSGIGLVAIIGGIPFLLGSTIQRGSKFSLAGVILFAATMVSLYLSSTIYRALPRTKIKRLFRLFDHSAIFLLIAGTYTPFALGALRGVWSWTLFSLVWSLAILGIGFKALRGLRYRWLSTGLYVGMGWMAVFAIRQFWLHQLRHGRRVSRLGHQKTMSGLLSDFQGVSLPRDFRLL